MGNLNWVFGWIIVLFFFRTLDSRIGQAFLIAYTTSDSNVLAGADCLTGA
jgi:hypothetical protein